MTNFIADDINNNYNTVVDNIKPQIDKWLQTEILNNDNVTLTKPKPCILAFSDYQFILYNYYNSTDGTTNFHYYVFRTPILSDNQTVKEIVIALETTLNSTEVAFDSYNINGVTLSETTISGGSGSGLEVIEITDVPSTATNGTLTSDQMTIANKATPSCIKFNNEYYYKMGEGHTADTYVYTHNGYTETDGGATIKYITVTVATSAWVLTSINVASKSYVDEQIQAKLNGSY